jgi:hypothetical protein
MEKIFFESELIALIIRHNFTTQGIEFYTPQESSQQLGYMNRPTGYQVVPHRHLVNMRKVEMTQETLFIRSGKVRVDFYSNQQQYVKSAVLVSGDVVLLAGGGHGLEMLEASEIIEVKQGPYDADKDKLRFDPHTGPFVL